jgi:transposase, IS30 family
VSAALATQIYFAHPYCSWVRGQNENSNGLLRQYVPKGSDLRLVTEEALSGFEKRLNARPRKCLEFRQPQMVFEKWLEAA